MGKRKYNLGDFFEIQISDNNIIYKGYGRIIGFNSRFKVPIIQLYYIDGKKQYNITQLQNAKPLIRLMCIDTAFRTGEWIIIGNIPVEPEKFVYWQYHEHFEEYVIMNNGEIERKIVKEDINDSWIEYSVSSEEMVRHIYNKLLKEKNK